MFRKPQSYNPYWVRKRIFNCDINEMDDYYNWINLNENFMVYGYEDFRIKDGMVGIPVYYLEKADLTDENPYQQIPDWQEHPWDAPTDAVEWKSAS